METTDETFNLRLFRKANKLTQDDVADYLGVSKAFISQVETGKVSLPDTQYLKIIQNRDWSVSEYRQFVDTYESVKNQALGKKAALLSIREKVDEEALYRVPLLPIFAQAGHLTGWSESVTEVECERVISPVKDIDMAVHIYGESMYPDIPNGSVVYVRKVTGHVIDYGRAYILDRGADASAFADRTGDEGDVLVGHLPRPGLVSEQAQGISQGLPDRVVNSFLHGK